MLAWGAKVSPEFRRKVERIAVKGSFDPDWLMSCIAFETGETFSPSIRNPQSGFTGLIQFGPAAASDLGTTLDALAEKSAEEQLDDVEKYFDRFAGQIKSLDDCYMAIFWPAAIGKPSDFQLITDSTSKAYVQNRGLDLNKDGTITKGEAAALVAAKLQRGRTLFATEDDRQPTEDQMANEQSNTTSTMVDLAGGGLAALLGPVAGIIFNAFSPKIKQVIDSAVGKAGGQPGVGQAVADTLGQVLQQQSLQLTGRTDPLEAAAVIVQPQNADKLRQVESAAVSATKERLDQLAPLLQATLQADQAKWDAERTGRASATASAIAEQQAGLWDYTRSLVYTTCVVMIAVSCGLLVLIGRQAWMDPAKIDSGLIGLAGPIWMGTMAAAFMAMVAHRFDGSRASSEQTRAVLAMVNKED